MGRNHPLIRIRRRIKRYGIRVQYAYSDSTDGAPFPIRVKHLLRLPHLCPWSYDVAGPRKARTQVAARTGVPIRGRERVRNGCDQSRLRTRKAPQTSGERLSNAGSVTQGPRTHTKARQKPPNAGSERLRAKGNARFLTQRKERRTLGRTRERGPLGCWVHACAVCGWGLSVPTSHELGDISERWALLLYAP